MFTTQKKNPKIKYIVGIWRYKKGKIPFCVRFTNCRGFWLEEKTVQQKLSLNTVRCLPEVLQVAGAKALATELGWLMVAWNWTLQSYWNRSSNHAQCFSYATPFWLKGEYSNLHSLGSRFHGRCMLWWNQRRGDGKGLMLAPCPKTGMMRIMA